MGETTKARAWLNRTIYVAAHGGFAWLVWAGVYGDAGWAANLLLFWTWAFLGFGVLLFGLMVVGYILGTLADEPEWPAPPDTSVPARLDSLVDLALTLAIAAGGWLWTAGAWFLKGALFRLALHLWQHGHDKYGDGGDGDEEGAPANRVAEHLHENGGTP